MPARPHIVKLRLDTKKEANPYVPSKLSGVEQSGKKVVTAAVDPVLVKRHLKAQKKRYDVPLKCKGFVEACHRLGVCTEEQDRILTKCIIVIKWPGVAFDLDEKKKSDE
ncbi:hypothetical protein HDU80_001544 [Chytriomyces hyalinus]|nr:hypothetical protein HDU80_001544 [Chytriomyces hyalinus]